MIIALMPPRKIGNDYPGVRGLGAAFDPAATYRETDNILDGAVSSADRARITAIRASGAKGQFAVTGYGNTPVYHEDSTGKLWIDNPRIVARATLIEIAPVVQTATPPTGDDPCPCDDCVTEYQDKVYYLSKTASSPTSRAVPVNRKVIVCEPEDGAPELPCEAELREFKAAHGLANQMRGVGTIPGSAADKAWCSNAARIAWKRGIIKEVELEQYYGDCLRRGIKPQPQPGVSALGMTAAQWDAAQQECLKKCSHTPGCYDECMKPLGRRPANIVNNKGGFSVNPYARPVAALPAIRGLANDDGGGTTTTPPVQSGPVYGPPYQSDVVYAATPCENAQSVWVAGLIGVGLGVLVTLMFSLMFRKKAA